MMILKVPLYLKIHKQNLHVVVGLLFQFSWCDQTDSNRQAEATDFKHFKKGDILKAAGYNAPALNSARGNILSGNYAIQWTGPLYLK